MFLSFTKPFHLQETETFLFNLTLVLTIHHSLAERNSPLTIDHRPLPFVFHKQKNRSKNAPVSIYFLVFRKLLSRLFSLKFSFFDFHFIEFSCIPCGVIHVFQCLNGINIIRHCLIPFFSIRTRFVESLLSCFN